MRTRTRFPTPCGAALLEAMVGLSVLLFGLIGMMHLQIYGIGANQGARAKMRAGFLANDLAAQLKALPIVDPATVIATPQLEPDVIHPHIDEVGRQTDAHVGVADALEALKIALVVRALEQGQQPGPVQDPEPFQLGLRQKFGGIRHLEEQVVKVRDDAVRMGFHHGTQAFQGLGLHLGELIIILDFLEIAHFSVTNHQ